jgi:hypothetical protein
MFDVNNDPLGIALQSRAADKRFRFQQDHPGSSFGPLPDSRWDGFFQAMDEAGVDGVADSSVGAKKGMWSGKAPMGSTYDPRYQTSAVDTMPSNQLGTAGLTAENGMAGESIPSMDSLLRATGGGGIRKALGRK